MADQLTIETLTPTTETLGTTQAPTRVVAPWRATLNDYLTLTKPRVISLLLLTAWMAQVMAARGWPGWGPFLAVGFGFYGMAGAAHTFNMVIDRDIDLRMTRTSKRPVASGRVSVANALLFAFALMFGSFALLWTGATPLAAWMALAGLLFYVLRLHHRPQALHHAKHRYRRRGGCISALGGLGCGQ